MNDCPNAEIRDMLPELVHGSLADTERMGVESHVASCVDCTSEVALLRAARRSLASTAPSVDVARIVRALPPASAVRATVPGVVSIDEARRSRTAARFGGWQRAAAALLVVAGATTVAVVKGRDPVTSVAPTAPVVAQHAPTTTAPAGPVAVPTEAGLSLGAGVGDLSDDALVALLGDLDDLDAAPGTEPAELLPDITGEGSE